MNNKQSLPTVSHWCLVKKWTLEGCVSPLLPNACTHMQSPLPPSSTHTTPTITRAKATVEAELAMLKEMCVLRVLSSLISSLYSFAIVVHRGLNELVDKSVVQMSER